MTATALGGKKPAELTGWLLVTPDSRTGLSHPADQDGTVLFT
jgi:hypothetical protein